eukprot:CAMPEP_0182447200 /NCGR_PEP_ID=MMETSP1172-20130603/12704_1 /TAXON_ID=708627 /ORGANISM="Timspurckia oligopyrenoides, Strain CCMP3278" /LENGTH=785 /DNA_ID=CAMNT_0024643551 /DNA_START=118 /DNA_END=2475 /DNA_ORIENTATION=-
MQGNGTDIVGSSSQPRPSSAPIVPHDASQDTNQALSFETFIDNNTHQNADQLIASVLEDDDTHSQHQMYQNSSTLSQASMKPPKSDGYPFQLPSMHSLTTSRTVSGRVSPQSVAPLGFQTSSPANSVIDQPLEPPNDGSSSYMSLRNSVAQDWDLSRGVQSGLWEAPSATRTLPGGVGSVNSAPFVPNASKIIDSSGAGTSVSARPWSPLAGSPRMPPTTSSALGQNPSHLRQQTAPVGAAALNDAAWDQMQRSFQDLGMGPAGGGAFSSRRVSEGNFGGIGYEQDPSSPYSQYSSASNLNNANGLVGVNGASLAGLSQDAFSMQMLALFNAQKQVYEDQIAKLSALNNRAGTPGAIDEYGYLGSPRVDGRNSARKYPGSPMSRGGGRGGGRVARSAADRSAGGAYTPRSQLLEEFRLTCTSRVWTLMDIRGHVAEFALDQNGSRFIQQRLETEYHDLNVMQMVLQESMMMASRLITDVFGNYVIQKLLELGGNIGARDLVFAELQGRVFSLSVHMYGCRVVQKALELLDVESRHLLESELLGHILPCIRDQNGNHVIQKCVELSSGTHEMKYIIDAMDGYLIELATHSYGCRVVQRLLEHAPLDLKRPITVEILFRVSELILDQYGNYVIQHVVEHGSDKERSRVVDALLNQVPRLSQHKYASNVIERCLQFGDKFQRRALIEELLSAGTPGSSSRCALPDLVRDQFGNYVVQRVLDVAEADQRERAVNLLRSEIDSIKKCSYGKHIMMRLEPSWTRNLVNPQTPSRIPQSPNPLMSAEYSHFG